MLTTWNICQVLPILKTENPKWFSLFCRGNNKRPNMIEQMLVDFPFKFQTSAYFLPLFLLESFVLPPLWSSFLRAVTDIRGNFFPKRVPILLKTRETDTHWIPLSSFYPLSNQSHISVSNPSRHSLARYDKIWQSLLLCDSKSR